MDYDDNDMCGHHCGSDCPRCGDGSDDFADPGGRSALRAASKNNPRIYSCPTCKRRRVLTRRDVDLGYQCDSCADATEREY